MPYSKEGMKAYQRKRRGAEADSESARLDGPDELNEIETRRGAEDGFENDLVRGPEKLTASDERIGAKEAQRLRDEILNRINKGKK